MNARHQVFVDERHLLPQIPRVGSNERRGRIDVTGIFQNSSWNRRENGVDRFDDAMVESVYRARSGRVPHRAHYEWLDARRLDLHIDRCSITDGVQHSVQRGNLDAMREREVPDLRRSEAGYAPDAHSRRIDDRVVM